jgi:hypothetical protein
VSGDFYPLTSPLIWGRAFTWQQASEKMQVQDMADTGWTSNLLVG